MRRKEFTVDRARQMLRNIAGAGLKHRTEAMAFRCREVANRHPLIRRDCIKLFVEISENKDGYVSDYYSKWFAEIVKDNGFTNDESNNMGTLDTTTSKELD